MKTETKKKLPTAYHKGWLEGFEARQVDIVLAIRETRTRKELIAELMRTYK